MTCFCFTFVSRSFWTLELTRRRNLTVSISFGCLAQERQSEVTGSAVKKACAKGLFSGNFCFALCCLGKIPGGAPFSQLILPKQHRAKKKAFTKTN